MSVPEAPGRARGGEGLSEPPGQGPLGRRASPQSGRPSWQWERLLGGTAKLVSAAASVLQSGSQAVCSAFCSPRCRHRLGSSAPAGEGEGEEVTEFTSPPLPLRE